MSEEYFDKLNSGIPVVEEFFILCKPNVGTFMNQLEFPPGFKGCQREESDEAVGNYATDGRIPPFNDFGSQTQVKGA